MDQGRGLAGLNPSCAFYTKAYTCTQLHTSPSFTCLLFSTELFFSKIEFSALIPHKATGQHLKGQTQQLIETSHPALPLIL